MASARAENSNKTANKYGLSIFLWRGFEVPLSYISLNIKANNLKKKLEL
jgi:hypothetical protein